MLTSQERTVLILLVCIIALGSLGQLIFKKYSSSKDIFTILKSDTMIIKLNVNTATKEELIALPYIGEYSAGRIIDYRERNDGIHQLDELKKITGIKEKNYSVFSQYLTVKPPKGVK